ncbi:Transposase (plasmid) [Roseomonas mucosa]|nr:Transposase [Roseomonas mucosa]
MKRFVEGADRRQVTLLPPCLDDYVAEENPVRVVEVFVNELDLGALGFAGVVPEVTGRPSYHPATMLKLYLYGYLNRIQSSRRLEREAGRNLELMWLTGRLAPDFKTIADFRRDNGPAIKATCRQFVLLCRKLDLFTDAVVAVEGLVDRPRRALDGHQRQGQRHRRLQRAGRRRHQAPPDRRARGHQQGLRPGAALRHGTPGTRGDGPYRADRHRRPRLLQG